MAVKRKSPKMLVPISDDRPIASLEADHLGRTHFAQGLAAHIREWRGKESLVIGLCGEWGCGKTSLKNLVLRHLEADERKQVDLMDLNPWQISGHSSITALLLKELGLKLRSVSKSSEIKASAEKLDKLAKGLSLLGNVIKYGGAALGMFVPGATILTSQVSEAVNQAGNVADLGAKAQAAGAGEESLADLKKEVSDTLLKLENPILVVIDDIDRLSTDEIREVFQLIKVNADFPNLIYLLLFDRRIVADALNKISGRRGNQFLEKIVQVLFRVPEPTATQMSQAFATGIDTHLGLGSCDILYRDPRWAELWMKGLSHYFTNLRCVGRFMASLGFYAGALRPNSESEVNVLDLIALEALRLFEPDVYDALPARKAELLQTMSEVERLMRTIHNGQETQASIDASIQSLLALAKSVRRERASAILSALFPTLFANESPNNQANLRTLRVCHERNFDRYFTLSLEEGHVPQDDIQALVGSITEPAKFTRLCNKLGRRKLLGEAFIHLSAYSGTFSRDDSALLICSLINAADGMSERWNYSERLSCPVHICHQLVMDALDRFNNDQKRFAALLEGLTASTGTRLALELTDDALVGSMSSLLNEDDQARLRELMTERVSAAAADGRLRKLPDLGGILAYWSNLMTREHVRAWFHDQLKSPQDARWFLSAIKMRPDIFRDFVDVEIVRKLVLQLPPGKLNKAEMEAWKAFQKNSRK